MTKSSEPLVSLIASAIEAEATRTDAGAQHPTGDGAAPAASPQEGLDPTRIAEACERLLTGKGSYRAFTYLQRVGPRDVEALFAVTRSLDAKERWAKLWIISRFLAKLSRDPQARRSIVEALKCDMPALHLLAKFTERANTAAKRLFERLHDPLLALIIPQLRASLGDARRTKLLAAMVASIERLEVRLREAITAHAGEAAVALVLPLLTIEEPRAEREGASATGLGERLGGRLRSISSSPNHEGGS